MAKDTTGINARQYQKRKQDVLYIKQLELDCDSLLAQLDRYTPLLKLSDDQIADIIAYAQVKFNC